MTDDLQAGKRRSDFAADLLLVPNLVSLGRIAGVFVAATFYLAGYPTVMLVLGIASGLTDYLDGYLARKLNQQSQLGVLLDLLADLLAALISMTLAVYTRLWPPYLIMVWGIRDMSVLALRASAAQHGFSLPSSMLGKVATNFAGWAYMTLALDLVRPFSGHAALTSGIHWFSLIAVHIGVALQWIAAVGYVRAFAARYRRNPGERRVS